MGLRAVIFDYGMVLTGQPSAEAHDAMVRITGLPRDQFETIYWADRHAYDEGKLTGLQFWQKLARDAKLNLDAAAIDELNRQDARMWTTQNPAMLAWQQQLKQHGIRTAILSNMGDSVLENIEREFDWLPSFDVLVWSYQQNMAKPDPAIYRLDARAPRHAARGNALHRRQAAQHRRRARAGHASAFNSPPSTGCAPICVRPDSMGNYRCLTWPPK